MSTLSNELFFKNNEIVKIGEYIKHVEYMEKNSLDYDNLGLPEELMDRIKNNKPVSSEEIFQVYFKIIPKEYWPIITESKKNINSTLPIFKDEILDREIDEKEISFWVLNEEKSEREAFRILMLNSITDTSKYSHSDYFSGETLTKFGKPENVDFLKKLGINDFNIENFNSFTLSFENTKQYLLRFLPELVDEFMLIKTHRDLVDWYQKIPLDMQIDYSFYDFSESPILDEYDTAWLANRPTPPPTPTPPPYAELRMGSRGQEVLDMKQRFYELGYFRTDNYSDQFNANTADTVRLFEKNNGLPADGVADPKMLALLFSEGAVGK